MAKRWGDMRNTALKGKLTISTRYSILDPRSYQESWTENRGSRIEAQELSIEYRVSRIENQGSRRSNNFKLLQRFNYHSQNNSEGQST